MDIQVICKAAAFFSLIACSWPAPLHPDTVVSGTIANSQWTAVGSPYQVTANLQVPAGVTLTIDAGVTVILSPNVTMTVRGILLAQGTADANVKFLSTGVATKWGGIAILGPSAQVTLQHVEVTGATVAESGISDLFPAVVKSSGGAKLRVENSWFHDFPSAVLDSGEQSELVVLDTLIEHCLEAIHSANGYADVERCHIRFLTGHSDCIDYDFESTPQSIIRDCLLEENADDDAIDLGAASPLIENCVVRNIWKGKALDAEGIGTPIFRNCLVYDCLEGIVSKDSCTPFFDNITIARCEFGVHAYEKNAGRGGGKGSAQNVIFWGVNQMVVLDDKSSFSLTYCDVEGGYAGEGNIDLDPMFVDPASNDFRLRPGSPAIGTGKDGVNMGAMPVAPPPPGIFLRADSNSDGLVDISDVLTVLFYAFGQSPAPLCLDALDADDGGSINIADPVFILEYLFQSGSPPAAPFPDAGTDPTTEDPLACGGE